MTDNIVTRLVAGNWHPAKFVVSPDTPHTLQGKEYFEPMTENQKNVFGNARLSGNAWVFGDARVYGNAWVSDNAWVFGDVQVVSGIIDGSAFIQSPNDFCQIVHGGVVWSRFVQIDGTYRTTQTIPTDTPTWISDAFDSWEARRG